MKQALSGHELQRFILELGNGFTFVERRKRMIIDGEDFYLDLLFYHRRLKRLAAVELKIDRCKAGFKGQMELPPKELLENKLHTALIENKARLAERKVIEQNEEKGP